jgi:thymidine kinase
LYDKCHYNIFKKLLQIARYACLIVKYANDVRYNSESIATHDKQTLTAISATKLSNLNDVIAKGTYDVIGIDEGQFFPDIVEFCEQVLNLMMLRA